MHLSKKDQRNKLSLSGETLKNIDSSICKCSSTALNLYIDGGSLEVHIGTAVVAPHIQYTIVS